MSILRRTYWLVFLSFVLGCANIFQGGAKTNTDPALFVDTQIKMNSGDYDGAINNIEVKMTSKYRTRRDVKVLWASAYAGRCGLNFLDLADKVKKFDGSTNLFTLLVN